MSIILGTSAKCEPGAGSAGASTAYHLHKFAAPCKLNITVYEREDHVGGRSTTVNVFGNLSEPVEVGASIFVKVNRNLVSAVKRFDLSTISYSGENLDGRTRAVGVWDGQKLVFLQNEESYTWWNLAKILWKYGLSAVRANSLMKGTVGKFLEMYERPVFPFKSIEEAAHSVGLTAATMLGEDFLAQNQIFAPFSTDIIQASTRVNYAQNLNQIHGLEAMVCMAAEGGMSVHGGNWQIFDRMLKSAHNNVRLSTIVTDIIRNEDGESYTIQSSSHRGSEDDKNTLTSVDTFDTVVIATPLQFSNITTKNLAKELPSPIPYVKLYVSLFTSPDFLFDVERLGLPAGSLLPTTLLTTLPSDGSEPPRFFSISTLRSITNPDVDPPRREYLYKIFSPRPLNLRSPDLGWGPESIEVTWEYHKVWHSYPYLPPRVTFDDPQLDDAGKLWYTSGIEPFITAMETASLMGMNVAQLIVDKWTEEATDKVSPSQAKGNDAAAPEL